MIAAEIRQIESRLAQEKTFIDRQALLKRLWKLRQEQMANSTPFAPTGDKNASNPSGH